MIQFLIEKTVTNGLGYEPLRPFADKRTLQQHLLFMEIITGVSQNQTRTEESLKIHNTGYDFISIKAEQKKSPTISYIAFYENLARQTEEDYAKRLVSPK